VPLFFGFHLQAKIIKMAAKFLHGIAIWLYHGEINIAWLRHIIAILIHATECIAVFIVWESGSYGRHKSS
jgi:hypothetical protein